MKILSFLVSFISKIKTADILNFLSVKYFGKGLLFLKIRHIRVNYYWNYGPSNLLFCFFRNRKNSRKLNNTFFWKLTPKQVFCEIFKFFDLRTTKRRPFNFFAKLNGNHILMANFSKLREYQIFGLIKLHNLSKGQLAGRMFKLWKTCVYVYRAVEHTTFEILTD